MQTIKTSVVVVLLLAVCYGAFVALNAPDPELPDSFQGWMEADSGDDFDMDMGVASMEDAVSVTPEQLIAGFSEATPMSPASSPATAATGAADFPGTNSNGPQIELPGPGSSASAVQDSSSATGSAAASQVSPSIPSNPIMSNTAAANQASATSSSGPAAMAGAPNPGLPNTSPQASQLPMPTLEDGPGLEGFPALDHPALGNASSPAGDKSSTPPLNRYANPENSASNSLVTTDKEEGNLMTAGFAREMENTKGGSTSSASTQPEGSASHLPVADFPTARQRALDLANQGQLKDALALLTPYYRSPELGYADSTDLVDILDALAREVVYSRRHLLESAHVARATDTVASVAKEYNITPELLNALNGLGDSKALVPGSQLKVIRGPVNAQVSLSKQELTLFVNDLYAGRFPVTFGKDPNPRQGSFEVVDRQTNRTYYASGGNVIQGSDPLNPYGGYWLNLGDDLCIHGTAEMASSDLANAGCISLAPLDAKHVFSILVEGSEVAIVQ